MYWFCLRHKVVEPAREGCEDAARLGPYPTREAAAAALDTARQRNEDWDDDPRWNDDDWGQGSDDAPGS